MDKIRHAFMLAVVEAWEEAARNADVSNVVWIMTIERALKKS